MLDALLLPPLSVGVLLSCLLDILDLASDIYDRSDFSVAGDSTEDDSGEFCWVDNAKNGEDCGERGV
jgi:hypothetical protein